MLALLTLALFPLSASGASCIITATGVQADTIGQEFDLSSLATATQATPFIWSNDTAGLEYQFTFCGVNKCVTALTPPTTTSSLCVKSEASGREENYFLWDEKASWIYEADSLRTTFQNGEDCDLNIPRIITVILQCSHMFSSIAPVITPSPDNQCDQTILLRIPSQYKLGLEACTEEQGGLSFGSVFLILLLVGAVLYVGIGCAYRRIKLGTTTAMDSMPHADFWAGIPSLVKDGWKFFLLQSSKHFLEGREMAVKQ